MALRPVVWCFLLLLVLTELCFGALFVYAKHCPTATAEQGTDSLCSVQSESVTGSFLSC